MAALPTVLSLKLSFVSSQVRLLSEAVNPSPGWRQPRTEVEESGLPEVTVDEALFRLNHLLQQHWQRVYAPQATYHVADQIDCLYWNEGGNRLDATRGFQPESHLALDTDYGMLYAPARESGQQPHT